MGHMGPAGPFSVKKNHPESDCDKPEPVKIMIFLIEKVGRQTKTKSRLFINVHPIN